MSKYIEEEITLHELAERFLGVNEYSEPMVYDMSDMGIEVLTSDDEGNDVYKPIESFVIKDGVNEYFTDGKIKVSANHRFIENDETVYARNHPDFTKAEGKINICDIEVKDLHSYLANGRLNHNTTSGGKSLAFHSSVRLRLKHMGQIKTTVGGQDKIVGIKLRCQVIKNRIGPPLRSADFSIYFDRGIDDYGSWLGVMKEYGLVKQGGAWYTYIDTETGEELKFQSKDFIELMEAREDLKDQIYNKICAEAILKYRSDNKDTETLKIDTTTSEE